jgi:hypothetical protein
MKSRWRFRVAEARAARAGSPAPAVRRRPGRLRRDSEALTPMEVSSSNGSIANVSACASFWS